jgi:hypothetical protein
LFTTFRQFTNRETALKFATYNAADQTDKTVIPAQQILNKEIKIPSSTINAIKNKMKMLIEEVKTLYDSATESGTEVEQFNNTMHRQGKEQEACFALPP